MFSDDTLDVLIMFSPVLVCLTCVAIGIGLFFWSLPNEPTDQTRSRVKYGALGCIGLSLVALCFACQFSLLALSWSNM